MQKMLGSTITYSDFHLPHSHFYSIDSHMGFPNILNLTKIIHIEGIRVTVIWILQMNLSYKQLLNMTLWPWTQIGQKKKIRTDNELNTPNTK